MRNIQVAIDLNIPQNDWVEAVYNLPIMVAAVLVIALTSAVVIPLLILQLMILLIYGMG